MDNCIFCKIVKKEIPSEIVYEDDEMLAFKDIHPLAPMHILMIPKQHIPTLSDCTDEHAGLLGRMMARAPKLAEANNCAAKKNADGSYRGGFHTRIHCGPSGHQEIYHLHVHVIGTPSD